MNQQTSGVLMEKRFPLQHAPALAYLTIEYSVAQWCNIGGQRLESFGGLGFFLAVLLIM